MTTNTGSYGFPGYGWSGALAGNFGIPGFETGSRQGGGSWANVLFPGAPYTGLVENPIPVSDVTNPSSPYYRPIYNPDGTQQEGFSINPAVPYQTTWNLQTYSGKKAPFNNIHEQMGEAMKQRPAAYPTFEWASPQALQGLNGYGGWASMLGFQPGGAQPQAGQSAPQPQAPQPPAPQQPQMPQPQPLPQPVAQPVSPQPTPWQPPSPLEAAAKINADGTGNVASRNAWFKAVADAIRRQNPGADLPSWLTGGY